MPFVITPQAFAAGTAANTVIGNQATATYQDESTNSYTSTSNLVTTTVQPVYSLTVTPNGTDGAPGQTQNATPGAIVYFPYTLTNTGNAAGTFTLTSALSALDNFNPVANTLKIYWDKDGNGTVSVGDTLLSQDTNGDSLISAVDTGSVALGPIAADGQAKLVLQYQIPSTGLSAGNYTNHNIIATSIENNTKIDDNNYSRTVVQNDAIITVVKAVDKASVDPSGSLKYTLTITNTGNATATNIIITDAIPGYTDFVSAVDPSTLGIFNYSTNNGGAYGADNTVPVPASSTTNVKYTLASLAAAASRTIEINVQVEATAPNTTIDNLAVFGYTRSGANVVPDANTNTVSTVVNEKSAVSITSESATEFASYLITATGTNAGAAGTGGTDISTTDVGVPAGTNFYFKNIITNNGNATDNFNVQYNAAVAPNQLPAGSSVNFYFMTDATTATNNNSPLLDSSGDGVADTGDLAAGGSITIVTRVFIPANATGTDLDAIVRATSTNGGTALGTDYTENLFDITTNRISSIVAPGVTIDNIVNGGINQAQTYTSSADGASVSFPVRVTNTGGSNDTFNLTSSGLPAGFSAQFFAITADDTVNTIALKGANSITLASAAGFAVGNQIVINGQTLTIAGISGGTLTFAAGQTLGFAAAVGDPVIAVGLSPVTSTGVMAKTTAKDFIAVVSVPVGTNAATYSGIIFTSTSTNNATVTDFVDNTIIVQEFRTFTLVADRSGSSPAGGVLFYDHILTNTGNVAETFNLSVAAGAGGFSYQLLDSSNNPITNPVAVAKGGTFNFKVKVTVPAGKAIGTVDNAVITATESPSVPALTQSKTNTDTTTVIAGYISLVKSVSDPNPALPGTAVPGDTLTYQIIYTNVGSQEARFVKIIDMIPANTTFVSGSLTINGTGMTDAVVDATDDNADYNVTTGNGVTFFVGTGANATTGGTLLPGASGTVTFQVTVD